MNASVTFTNNSALLGSVLYTASLASCSWVANSVPNSFDKSYLSHSPFFDIRYIIYTNILRHNYIMNLTIIISGMETEILHFLTPTVIDSQ